MKRINIIITEKDLIRLMKENPQINIKKGNELYFKNDVRRFKENERTKQNNNTGK